MRQPPTYMMPGPTVMLAVGVDGDEVAVVRRAGGADDVDGLESQGLAGDESPASLTSASSVTRPCCATTERYSLVRSKLMRARSLPTVWLLQSALL